MSLVEQNSKFIFLTYGLKLNEDLINQCLNFNAFSRVYLDQESVAFASFNFQEISTVIFENIKAASKQPAIAKSYNLNARQ